MNIGEIRTSASAYRLSQAIHAFCDLRLPDALLDGPRTAYDLATALGLHEPYLGRLLRALAAEGVIEQNDGGTFALTEASRELAGDGGAGAMIRGWSVLPPTYAAFAQLGRAIREGRPPFELAHGMDFHAYLASHPDDAAAYDTAMESTVEAFESTVQHYDFSRFGTVADIGGGGGGFLVALLRAHPAARGLCIDLPPVIENARRRGIPDDVTDRLELIAADVFVDPIPAADCYTMFTVLRLFEDEDAARLLRAVRGAMPPSAVVVIEDFWLPDGPLPPLLGLADLHALCAYGGRDRTRAEYEALLASAGFRFGHIELQDGSPYAIFEALPV